MGAVLLDSTVLIDILRGRPITTERVMLLKDRGDIAYTCAVNIEEIVRGLRPSEQNQAATLFEGLRVARLGLAEGSQAGTWRRHFDGHGRSLSQADCLVAAAALGVGASLATGNPKDFPMPEIQIEHWPVGQ